VIRANKVPRTDWKPNPDTMAHCGLLISDYKKEYEYFAAPPAEIGRLISSSSTLAQGKLILSFGVKIFIIVLVLLPFYIKSYRLLGSHDVAACILFMAGTLFSIWLYFAISPKYRCSFVGEAGFATYELAGSRSSLVREYVVLFESMVQLFEKENRIYRYNVLYMGTNFYCQLHFQNGGRYDISGSYYDKRDSDGHMKWTPAVDLRLFAKAVENAWTDYFIDSSAEILSKQGYIEFEFKLPPNILNQNLISLAKHFRNPKAVRVGEGFLELVGKDDKVDRFLIKDMKSISLSQGKFCFEHSESSTDGESYSFMYTSLPNVQAFLVCLDKYNGIRIN
jgi:hypothetical protein